MLTWSKEYSESCAAYYVAYKRPQVYGDITQTFSDAKRFNGRVYLMTITGDIEIFEDQFK